MDNGTIGAAFQNTIVEEPLYGALRLYATEKLSKFAIFGKMIPTFSSRTAGSEGVGRCLLGISIE
jgi:hypothetical protein